MGLFFVRYRSERKPEPDSKQGQTEKLTHCEPAESQIAKLCIRDADKFNEEAKDGVAHGEEP